MSEANNHSENFNKVVSLIDYVTQNPKRDYKKWMWGEALFNYALSELDDFLESDRYFHFYNSFGEY